MGRVAKMRLVILKWHEATSKQNDVIMSICVYSLDVFQRIHAIFYNSCSSLQFEGNFFHSFALHLVSVCFGFDLVCYFVGHINLLVEPPNGRATFCTVEMGMQSERKSVTKASEREREKGSERDQAFRLPG